MPLYPTPQEGSYESGMWVYDLQTLESLYKQRLWGLCPDMRVHMDDALVSQLRADPFIYNSWVPMAADTSAIYNENDDDLMVYSFTNYHVDFELDALMRDATVASRASSKAVGYLARIDGILSSLSVSGRSERERLLAIHDWMVANTSYDTDFAEASYMFYGPLDAGKAVCQGYAELFYYLANRAGVECYTVGGMASSGAG